MREIEGIWHCILQQRRIFYCFHSGTTQLCCWKGSMVREYQAWQETLDNQGFCWFWSLYPAENLALQKRKAQVNWFMCHLGIELDILMGTSHFILFLSSLALANEFIWKQGYMCILTLIQIVIYLGVHKEHWSRGFFLPTEEDSLSILTKLNEEKRPNSVAIEELRLHVAYYWRPTRSP